MPGRAPYGVVKDQPDTVNEFSGAMVNSFISKFAIIPLQKQVVKIKKIEADSDIDGDGNHTCSRLQTFQKYLFLAC